MHLLFVLLLEVCGGVFFSHEIMPESQEQDPKPFLVLGGC